MTDNQPPSCGLNGCANPTDPDSPVGRCIDCTSKYLAEVFSQRWVEDKRTAAMTGRASVDAILLVQAFLREDDDAGTRLIVEPFASQFS